MDYDHLSRLRRDHPAWRLLTANSAPLIAAFLHQAFIAPNVRTMAEQDLAAEFDDYLYRLREQHGDDLHPRSGMDYLKDWAGDERGWLRRYYPPSSDEPHYDLTPAAEQALQWLAGLEDRSFVGAESRLKVVFDLLREIEHGTETDAETRIEALEQRRAKIDAEIAAVREGHMTFMDDTRLRERFLQAVDTARGENRRIMEILRELERHAIAVRNTPPESLAALDEPAPKVELPMDRPLYSPPLSAVIDSTRPEDQDADIDPSVLFEQVYIDRERLRARMRRALQTRRSITLAELLEETPLEQGLAELVAWLSLATSEGLGVIDEERSHTVAWTDGTGRQRRATLPVVIFTGKHAA